VVVTKEWMTVLEGVNRRRSLLRYPGSLMETEKEGLGSKRTARACGEWAPYLRGKRKTKID
jgi:hypothetical protein